MLKAKKEAKLAKQRIPQKLEPENFRQEFTTLWSFPERGDWATHKQTGNYRGNWSPYIPRNLIFKYSKAGQTVLDPFCGSGTTAIEAKLLGRKCMALDINEHAVKLTRKNLAFGLPKGWRYYKPDVRAGMHGTFLSCKMNPSTSSAPTRLMPMPSNTQKTRKETCLAWT